MRPIYAFRSENEIAKDLRTLERRLRDRMIAARMAVPFLQQVEPGERPKLPKSIKRLSLNEMAAFVAEEAEQSEPAQWRTLRSGKLRGALMCLDTKGWRSNENGF